MCREKGDILSISANMQARMPALPAIKFDKLDEPDSKYAAL